MIAVENSFIIFQSDLSDERALLRKVGDKISLLMDNGDTSLATDPRVVITSVTANEHEDQIFVTTSSG